MHRPIVFVLLALLLAALAAIASGAIVGPSIAYQGKLTDGAGTPLNGTYSMIFKLYELSGSGTALDTVTENIAVNKGLFDTTLLFDENLFDGRRLYLGVQVGNDPEMTPRQMLRAVPYALSLRPGALISDSSASSPGGTMLRAMATGTDGIGLSGTGVKIGVNGTSTSGIGILGESANIAVKGLASGSGTGVKGEGQNGVGVYGNSTGGTGVYGYGMDYGVKGKGAEAGVRGEGGGIGVNGYSSYGGIGVYGESVAGFGVYGDTGRADGKYGLYTGDYLFARGAQLPASDVAEYMPVAEDVAAGTVLVIGDDGRLTPSTTGNDTRVAGIVSTDPALFLGTKEDGNPGEALIAVTGRVPCKVDASAGAIRPGDLLCTSNTSGHAMRATDPRVGTVLGKAMGTLESGTGTIDVIIALQ